MGGKPKPVKHPIATGNHDKVKVHDTMLLHSDATWHHGLPSNRWPMLKKCCACDEKTYYVLANKSTEDSVHCCSDDCREKYIETGANHGT